ncbi:hypothetical protein NQ317_007068 [Molorchus minor]|uniref:Uncharacterized protein n=1 Tax=Molorchus minor TaxID=1323400 RepID=A0ABQ9K3X5_9CUCU|nr:hypothetical protein NQ317_007068 [Molorchus minor]
MNPTTEEIDETSDREEDEEEEITQGLNIRRDRGRPKIERTGTRGRPLAILDTMPCRPSTSECGKGSEPHLIQSSTSLTSTASKAEEQILNWLKSLHHRKQRTLWGLILI